MVDVQLSALEDDLEGIIALQKANHASLVPADLWDGQGFVTMEYTLAQLQTMCGPYHHAVAKADGAVVGYALVMLNEQRAAFPLLGDMFAQIEAGTFGGAPIAGRRYVVMGQVCIAARWRGQGIFALLYQRLREQLSADFDLIATEVSTKNSRSMGAHHAVGFRDIVQDTAPAEAWKVIAWDWR